MGEARSDDLVTDRLRFLMALCLVALGNVQLSLRTTVSRVLSSWSAIATGMSIGREGPLIEFGGSLGAALGRATATSLDRTRVLVAAGTAAGVAAAYNTPFAAVLFVFETIVGIAAPEALLPTVAATVIATTLTRAVVGAGPIYGQRSFGPESTAAMLSFAALACWRRSRPSDSSEPWRSSNSGSSITPCSSRFEPRWEARWSG